MNNKELIDSGLLERYAMGDCSQSEMRLVETALKDSPEVRNELTEIENGLLKFAQTYQVQPPSSVKEKLMQKIAHSTTETPVVQIQKTKSSKGVQWLAAASIILLLGSLSVNYLLFNSNSSLKNQLAEIRQENSILASDLNINKAGYQQSRDLFDILSDSSMQVVLLKSAKANSNEYAKVYWNKNTSDVYVQASAIHTEIAESDLQLWAIVDGVPVDAGIIQSIDVSGLPQKMKSFSSAQAFAVTVERKGGSPTPTMENLLVVGGV